MGRELIYEYNGILPIDVTMLVIKLTLICIMM